MQLLSHQCTGGSTAQNGRELTSYRARVSLARKERVQEVDGEFVIADRLKNTRDGRPFYQKQVKEADMHIPNIKLLECTKFWIADGTFSSRRVALWFTFFSYYKYNNTYL